MYGSIAIGLEVCYDVFMEQSCYKVWKASLTHKRGEVVCMEMFSFQDLILFATFLIALLAYIDRDNKRK